MQEMFDFEKNLTPGFTGLYFLFLFLLKNIHCGHSSCGDGSNMYSQSVF